MISFYKMDFYNDVQWFTKFGFGFQVQEENGCSVFHSKLVAHFK